MMLDSVKKATSIRRRQTNYNKDNTQNIQKRDSVSLIKETLAERRCWERFRYGFIIISFLFFAFMCLCWRLTTTTSRNAATGLPLPYSFHYFVLCGLGGMLGGAVHLLILPLDLVKCRMQVGEYTSLLAGLRHIYFVEGGGKLMIALPCLMRGWLPSLIGYCIQTALKFGLYEFFKYVLLIRPTLVSAASTETNLNNAIKSNNNNNIGVNIKTAHHQNNAPADAVHSVSMYVICIFLLSSCLAELIADVFLVPWEAIKLKVQITLPQQYDEYPPHMRYIVPRIWSTEGLYGFYKSLIPVWGRQLPSTMMKFATFEKLIEILHILLLPSSSETSSSSLAHNAHATSSESALPLMENTAVAAAFLGKMTSQSIINNLTELNSTLNKAVVHPVHAPIQASNSTEIFISLLAGVLAGIAAALVSHPADTILSKINQSTSKEGSSLISDTLVYTVHDKKHKNIINANTNISINADSLSATIPYPSTLVHRKGDSNMDECENSDFAHKSFLYNDNNETSTNEANINSEHCAHVNNNNNNSNEINNTNCYEGEDQLCTESFPSGHNNPTIDKSAVIVENKLNNTNDINDFGHANTTSTKDNNDTSSTVNMINTNSASYTDKCNAKRLSHRRSWKNTLWQIVVVELGWRGLWSGLLTRLLMISVLTAIQWITYDSFKMLVGLPGTGRVKKEPSESTV